jgi:hypothetical protein
VSVIGSYKTVDDAYGLGEVVLFTDPDGHELGLYWDVERYRADDSDRPALKNQAAAYPGRGANLRRLDHVNYLTADVPATSSFLSDVLGARCTEQIVKDDGRPQAIWYVWEPGGNRIEICNAGARLILAPDWETVSWTQAERSKGQAWGLKTIGTFHTHGTPVVPVREDPA